METIRMSLATLAGGKAADQFDECLQRVLEDIVDDTKPAEAKRVITLKVSIQPTETRAKFIFAVECKTSLAGMKPLVADGYISNGRNGVEAAEVGQMTIQDAISKTNDADGNVTVIRSK